VGNYKLLRPINVTFPTRGENVFDLDQIVSCVYARPPLGYSDLSTSH